MSSGRSARGSDSFRIDAQLIGMATYPTDCRLGIRYGIGDRAAVPKEHTIIGDDGGHTEVGKVLGMGNELSGGEQQMLAIGRALMTNPKLLILDEATEGLAPQIRAEIWRCLADLKKQGQSILVIDKNVAALTSFADRHFIIEKGQVVWTGSSPELEAHPEIQHQYLGV